MLTTTPLPVPCQKCHSSFALCLFSVTITKSPRLRDINRRCIKDWKFAQLGEGPRVTLQGGMWCHPGKAVCRGSDYRQGTDND